MMHRRFITLWDRLVESGINVHVERRTIELYKAVRSLRIRQIKIKRENDYGAPNTDWSDLAFFLLVFAIGNAASVLVFLIECCEVFEK